MGEPCEISTGVTVSDEHIQKIIHGEVLASPSTLTFRDPLSFKAGELHRHYAEWEKLAGDDPSFQQAQVLKWIHERVSVFDYFRHYCRTFKGKK